MKDLLAFGYLFKGLGFLGKHKRLFNYIFIQIISGLTLFSLFFFFLINNGMDFYDHYFISYYEDESFWINALYYIIIGPFFLVLFALGTYLTFLVTQLVVAPINSLLAKKSSTLYRGKTIEKGDDPFFKSLLKDVRYELYKLLLFTAIYLFLFLFTFIPVIGPVIFMVVSTAFIIFSLSFEFIELAMDRERTRVRHRVMMILKRPFIILSFGGSIFLLFTLPIIGIILYPAVVVGAVLLYEDRFAKDNEEMKMLK